MFMSAAEYRESLRRQRPRVFLNGRAVDSVADEPAFAPGIAAIGVTYDVARRPEYRPLALARQSRRDREVNRLLHVNESTSDLLAKLELVRLLCQETGCAQRYLTHDGLNALYRATWEADHANGGDDTHQRLLAYIDRVQDEDLTLGIAMTDAKGDRSRRPHEQAARNAYVHVADRRPDGVVLRGTKAIVTSAPYVHELLVLPGRQMTADDRDFAIACAVPLDAPGVTVAAKPAGRPGQPQAHFSNRYGQSVGAVIFDDVFVPWDRVFVDGDIAAAETVTRSYATHHRQSCIAARAGFGDLLIGAGAMMIESNGLDPAVPHLREAMVNLIKIVEGFFACGIAASVYGIRFDAGCVEPEPVYANIGKLLLATQIYDMHRLAHEVSGGLIVALPGPDEDHNPETAAELGAVLQGRPDIPYAQRAAVARFVEDLTASETGGWYSLISLHGGGSPEAMKREIMRRYPVGDRKALVARLLDRGVLADAANGGTAKLAQPDRCCPTGCDVPEAPAVPGARIPPEAAE